MIATPAQISHSLRGLYVNTPFVASCRTSPLIGDRALWREVETPLELPNRSPFPVSLRLTQNVLAAMCGVDETWIGTPFSQAPWPNAAKCFFRSQIA